MKVAAAQIACRHGCIAANLAMHLDVIGARARRAASRCWSFPSCRSPTTSRGPMSRRSRVRSTVCDELRRHRRGRRSDACLGRLHRGEAPAARSTTPGARRRAAGVGISTARSICRPTASWSRARYYSAGRTHRPSLARSAAPWRGCDADLRRYLESRPCPGSPRSGSRISSSCPSPRRAMRSTTRSTIPAAGRSTSRHTALTYGLPIVMANHCGERAGFDFWGGSRILDAIGRELARAGDEPGMIGAMLDRDATGQARQRLPTIRDADPDFVRGALDGLRHRRGPDRR